MGCAVRLGVYAFSIGFFICAQGAATKVFGKDGKDGGTVRPVNTSKIKQVSISPTEFQWREHPKLSWEDFKGPVNAENDESAAATHCGIGFRMNKPDHAGNPEVVVYNTFYVNKSWVRSDAKISSILDHEQGHFDLCEIFTRKLSARLRNFDFSVPDMKKSLLQAFNEVNVEYEKSQQAYESETTHGTNLGEQRKWEDRISHQLN